MDQDNGDNRPVRARPHRKLGRAGTDRRMAGTGSQEPDGRGVDSRIHRGVAADRIRSGIFRMGSTPGVQKPAA